jgi:uncharacterized membrane protein YhiD involved in acid resistance
MLDISQKRKIRGIMYHKATLITLFILVLLFAHSTWSVYQKKRASEELKNVSLQNVATLLARDKELKNKIQGLQTEPGIEAEIRSKFTVAKNGENMVVVVEDTSTTTGEEMSDPGFWQKIWDFLFK